jgi:hypothetical protein
MTTRPATRFRSISDDVRGHGLWAFPLAVKRVGDHWDKKPLVKWKHLQEHSPTDDEIRDWCPALPLRGRRDPDWSGRRNFSR